MEYQPKLNQKYIHFSYFISCFYGTSHKKYIRRSHQFICFLLFYISSNMSKYHFWQLFRTSFNMIWKKIFVTNFPFLTDSLRTSYALKASFSWFMKIIVIYVESSFHVIPYLTWKWFEFIIFYLTITSSWETVYTLAIT